MTSRPGLGIPESLQHRGNGLPPRGQVRRRPSKPVIGTSQYPQQLDCIDPSLEADRWSAEEAVMKTRAPGTTTKVKPAPLDGIHTTSNDVVRPTPKGKPPLFFSSLAGHGLDLPVHSPHGQSVTTSANLPVPPRPGSSLVGDLSQQPRILPGGTGVKNDAVVKPPSPNAPPPAILFAGGKTVDFFPWTGNPSEDILNEALVKQGISNKPQIMNETNTARPTLWSNLKNKSGLSNLSLLFVAVLEKRQACGRLTAANTFKPPPRLTLRDSTREAWLHDLANPTVGLRRLSRTIPHGITGKVLLEQCLNKNIPIPRAMWLAKCVGINEMRSHKRKGQAGTITWVRGWTSSVEQFLDSTIATIGQQEWKPRITYALQLVTHLYKEHLLEEEHFLDWILKNLDSSPPERLFLWLLLVSIYWQDLSSSRRRSKRLAENLINHAEKLYHAEEGNQSSPVLGFLEDTIIRLLKSDLVSLLLPKTWDRHGPVLDTLSQRRSLPQISRAVAELDERNRRLLHPSRGASSSSKDSSGKIYRLLDSVDYSLNIRIDKLAYECLELMPDDRRLISTVLHWASSCYREGSHRLYLVTRLLRKWNHLGADVDDGILFSLRAIGLDSSHEPHVVFRIIAELVRSRTFSVGRYLQWLIATGSLGQDPDPSAPLAWPARLITEIPPGSLPEQVRILRGTLLRGTGYSTENEEQALDQAKDLIRRQAPAMFGIEGMVDFMPFPMNSLPNLNPSIHLELGVWIRQQIALTVEVIERVPTKESSIEESSAVCRLSSHDFHVIRSYIEAFEDLSILADIIGVVSTSLDPEVLTSAAHTLHYHQKAFVAIGAFEPLFAKIAMRYAAIRTVRFPEREFIMSLTELARVAQTDPQLVQLLAYDLSRHEQKISLAACSPASDNMADAFQNTTIDTEDEIDRILSSGTSMDRQMMSRVFVKVIHNIEEQVSKSSQQFENHAIWFYRLRSFDESSFEVISTEWLMSSMMTHQVQLISAALPPLVASGCVLLSKIMEIVKRCISKQRASKPEEALRISIAGLGLILPSENLNRHCQPQDAYQYRLMQQKLCQDSEGRILEAIDTMLELGSVRVSPPVQSQVMSVLLSKPLLAVVKHFAINDAQLLSRLLGIGASKYSPETCSRIKSLLDCLLDPYHHLHIAKKSLEQQITLIVDSADDLSLPFCQLELRQIFALDLASADTSVDEISSALLEAVKVAVEKDHPSWSNLVAGLEADLTRKIQEHAERELLNASAFLSTTSTSLVEPLKRDDKDFIQKYLTVIDFTAADAPRSGQAFSFGALIDRLKGTVDALGKITADSSNLKESTLTTSHIWPWLDALLHLALVHSSALSLSAGNQHQAALLWSLRSLIAHPALSGMPSTAQHVYDVAVLLSDSVSDEVRNHLAKLDATKSTDNPHCAFLFGTIPPLDGWLVLTKPVIPPVPSQSISSPQMQPQHSGQGQLPQQYQQVQTPSPASLQRSLSQQHQQQQQLLQAQAHGRVYPQYPQHPPHPQHNKMPPQFQRMVSATGQSPQQSQLQQMQHMQHMQGVAQLRATQPSPIQQQRSTASSPQNSVASGKAIATKLEKPEMRPVPFSLKRWEILPESGGNPAGNETAISLGLFGARKV